VVTLNNQNTTTHYRVSSSILASRSH